MVVVLAAAPQLRERDPAAADAKGPSLRGALDDPAYPTSRPSVLAVDLEKIEKKKTIVRLIDCIYFVESAPRLFIRRGDKAYQH